MKHEVYTWVHRVNAHGGQRLIGWKCLCSEVSRHAKFPTREAALADAEKHQKVAAK